MHKLVDNADIEVHIGTTVTSFRGDTWEVTGFSPPHNGSSSGRIQVKDTLGNQREFYPHVFNLKIIQTE